MNDRLQTQLFGAYFGSFLPHSSRRLQTSQNLPSNFWIFASALILEQPPSPLMRFCEIIMQHLDKKIAR
ncbi:MAG: hypothetical protein U9R69_04980 [Thermodesulfobacteriota bacterium]|nr:hypothetical protein [Thermodesulfobacteriota bacterium]